jgi:hypothetical protein
LASLADSETPVRDCLYEMTVAGSSKPEAFSEFSRWRQPPAKNQKRSRPGGTTEIRMVLRSAAPPARDLSGSESGGLRTPAKFQNKPPAFASPSSPNKQSCAAFRVSGSPSLLSSTASSRIRSIFTYGAPSLLLTATCYCWPALACHFFTQSAGSDFVSASQL